MSILSNTRRRYVLVGLGGLAIITAPIVLGAGFAQDKASAAGAAPIEKSELHSYADIVAADKPAVVTITTKVKLKTSEQGSGDPDDDFFRQFFGDDGLPSQAPRPAKPAFGVALGSGFIVSSDGMIVTNNHVIDGATDIRVTLDDGNEFKATLLGRDAKTDLAVVKIDTGRSLPTVSWGNSATLRAGDAILAIGNPFGIGTTVTSGIVSARGRDLHNGPYDDFIQVDAAINRGNSGGPLVDAAGKVVGINTAIYSPNGGSVGVGFAIPSDEATKIVAKLEKGEAIEYGFIGVEIQQVTKDIADAIGLKDASGALVAKVAGGSPAARAGLKTGDVVTRFEGRDVMTPKDLSRFVADAAPGQKANLAVWRKGRSVDIPLTVGRSGKA